MKRLLLLIAMLAVPTMSSAAQIEGRVVSGDEPLPGVFVSAYSTLDFTSPPAASSAASDSEGSFQLEVPVGTYALFGWDADRSHFAFCGRNPVNVAEGPVWAGLQAVPAESPTTGPYDDEYSGAIEGQVLHDGVPTAGRVLHEDRDGDVE